MFLQTSGERRGAGGCTGRGQAGEGCAGGSRALGPGQEALQAGGRARKRRRLFLLPPPAWARRGAERSGALSPARPGSARSERPVGPLEQHGAVQRGPGPRRRQLAPSLGRRTSTSRTTWSRLPTSRAASSRAWSWCCGTRPTSWPSCTTWVLQFDSSPVLCYLHVDLINSMSAKEGRKLFLDFCHTFLDKAGLLRVPVPPHVQFELDRNRPELIPDDVLRRFLAEIQNFSTP
ncbi:uncharacterized protein LOC142823579 [Pelodiscus sinensis]|uniref:uncharacterized protein LOC142823579 n=1 Tax=Pelodiscus sinensis TaxID=13735 RepID=UPI003F6B144B